jgi:hypothetical protein
MGSIDCFDLIGAPADFAARNLQGVSRARRTYGAVTIWKDSKIPMVSGKVS